MVAEAPALTAEAVAFLLEILEQPEPLLSAATAQLRPDETGSLAAAGLLLPHDHEEAVTSQADHDDAPVSLFWSETVGGLAYFSPTAGIVAVSSNQLRRWRADMEVVLAAMTAGLDLPPRRKPFALLEGLLWELGDARLHQQKTLTPIWFCRRLWDPAVRRQVQGASVARPHTRQRVLLTSSRPERVQDVAMPAVAVVPVQNVLVAPDGITVSAEILDARLSGVAPPTSAEPVQLSEDGHTLVILGGEPIHFSTERQISVIRKLVAARKTGRRLRARDLTDHGTLRRFFGEEKWAQLSPYVTSVGGRWGFDV